MTKLISLSPQDRLKATLIKQSIDRFFYKSRLNIALHSFFSSDTYTSFRDDLEMAMYTQIAVFASPDKINQIVGVNKAVGELTEEELLENLTIIWILLEDVFEKEKMNLYLQEAARVSGNYAVSKTGSTREFLIDDPIVKSTITRQLNKTFTQIDETTQGWIARTVEQGLRDGLSHVEIAQLIRNDAEAHVKVRASLISENEASTIAGKIELAFLKKNDISKHKWITARDEIVCPVCWGNESVGEIDVGKSFPGGTVSPPAHPRCRCFIEPILPDNFKLTWWGQK